MLFNFLKHYRYPSSQYHDAIFSMLLRPDKFSRTPGTFKAVRVSKKEAKERTGIGITE